MREIPSSDLRALEQKLKEYKDIITVDEGFYKIYTAINNTSIVDISPIEGEAFVFNVRLNRDNNERESIWNIVPIKGSGYLYSIFNDRDDSLRLGVVPGSPQNPFENVVAELAGADSLLHIWYFADAGDDVVYIVNAHYGDEMLDVQDGSVVDGTNIIISPPYHGGQRFRLKKMHAI
ncbi:MULTISPECIES: RICIN domain-containing protein [Pseudomonas]|uniref:RICIN domain-containing protein n=1 Tax=Pseudomonas TaxID=286 RepID=UPI00155D9FE0|nr:MULTISPECIES: RICIN domain-containing protein [Pseudomonas]MCE0461372.1 RICIN domain-containing protein [Pseudomonas uvaldensis]